jgi:hypothetical protein
MPCLRRSLTLPCSTRGPQHQHQQLNGALGGDSVATVRLPTDSRVKRLHSLR